MFVILAVCLVNYMYYSVKSFSPSRSVLCLLVLPGLEEDACETKHFFKFSFNTS